MGLNLNFVKVYICGNKGSGGHIPMMHFMTCKLIKNRLHCGIALAHRLNHGAKFQLSEGFYLLLVEIVNYLYKFSCIKFK